MRVTLLHNPSAGKHAEEDLHNLMELLRGARHQVRYQSVKEGHWARVLDEPADAVAVAGGDGTVARVAKRMAGKGVPLAVLPAGTANNIARSLGLVERPVEELVRGWKEARRVKLDIGHARGPWGERPFIEGVGAGLFANVVPEVDSSPKLQDIKSPADKVKFALRKIVGCLDASKAVKIEARLDGEDVSGEYVLFEALNIPNVGPNLFLAPDSKPGDGQLDLVMVTEAERDRLRHYLETWQDEKRRLAVLPTRQGRRLEMGWSGFRVHIDDEFWPEEGGQPAAGGSIEIATEQGSVEFLVPVARKKD